MWLRLRRRRLHGQLLPDDPVHVPRHRRRAHHRAARLRRHGRPGRQRHEVQEAILLNEVQGEALLPDGAINMAMLHALTLHTVPCSVTLCE